MQPCQFHKIPVPSPLKPDLESSAPRVDRLVPGGRQRCSNLATIAVAVITYSIVVHGASVTPLMNWFEMHSSENEEDTGSDDSE